MRAVCTHRPAGPHNPGDLSGRAVPWPAREKAEILPQMICTAQSMASSNMVFCWSI